MKRKIKRFVCFSIFMLFCLGMVPAEAGAFQEGRDHMYSGGSLLKIRQEEKFHILLIGQDQREGEKGKRSDSMMVCSYCPEENKLLVTSFLRDLYVKIPGYGYERINAAYAYGGAELLKKTIEENFGIPIDGTVEVDFKQFAEIIDLLGGVTLDIRQDEAREINRLVPDGSLAAGEETLNGQQALVYARIRKLDPDSDFSRTERQRKLISALMDQNRNISFSTMVRLTGRILPSITTSLNSLQILNYGKLLMPCLKTLEIEGTRIPEAGDAQDREIRGMQVLVPDLPSIREKLQTRLGIPSK